jgi:ATP-dependent Clp protease ATP-binding subunit ClpB
MGMAELTKIVEFQLGHLERQLAEANLSLKISEAAKSQLAQEGFDPAYGARPLKRVIQQRLANPLASALLSQQVTGGDTVEIDWDGHAFTFQPSRKPS